MCSCVCVRVIQGVHESPKVKKPKLDTNESNNGPENFERKRELNVTTENISSKRHLHYGFNVWFSLRGKCSISSRFYVMIIY